MGQDCKKCTLKRAILRRPKTGDALCKECFFACFEIEIHETIARGNLFKPGMKVAIGASGGKDSTVLAHVMKLLNERMKYGLELYLLSIDEGIRGYRDDSLETVKGNQVEYSLPLEILSYQDLYGWTMDQIVKEVGLKNNCTFCGVFRRQALDRGAALLGCDMIVTGHNADDVAETILMNLLRGDISRLKRGTSIITGSNSHSESSPSFPPESSSSFPPESSSSFPPEQSSLIPRCKPFKYTYEKEIVMYAYFKKLNYFSTECIYSPNSYRGFARSFLKDLESIRSSSILDIIHSAEQMSVKGNVKLPPQGYCNRCGYISSQNICKACVLLQGLNSGLPRLGVGKSSRVSMIKSHPSTLMVTHSVSPVNKSCHRKKEEERICCSSKSAENKTCCSSSSHHCTLPVVHGEEECS